jgi:hypothetical protein
MSIDTILHNVKWSPFSIVIIAIEEYSDVLFTFMLSRLSPNDMTRTFSYDGVEHTLLSFCCSRTFYNTLYPKKILDRISSLVQAGCQFDQEIGNEGKTALSFMVPTDETLFVVKWCIEELGVTHRKGHLLHYACNFISRDEHEARVLSGEWSYRMVHRNFDMYQYLLSLDLDVDECMEFTGLTPLLAACSEGNPQKVHALLQVGGINISLYRKTNEGLDVWFWADHYKYSNIIEIHKEEQKRYWQQMMEETSSQLSLLQDVPVRDILQAVTSL